MEKEIKLIVSDIDGTLVDPTEVIPEELKQTVRKCGEAGIIFAFATGRTKELTDPFVQMLGVEVPCVEANGAYIMQGDRCLLDHGFSIGPIREILQEAHDLGLTVTISDTRQERAARETDYVKEHKKIGNRFVEPLPLEEVAWDQAKYQKVMIMDEHQTGQIEGIREKLRDYSDRYWITTYSDRAVELGPRGCNKATGVRELAEMLGVSMENVMACGDFSNDLEMIRQAGVGVAVGNASDQIKAEADFVAEGCFAFGVIEAIEAVCFHS